jgi:uncharacterized protein DUF1918
MKAQVGDRIVVESERVSQGRRSGVVEKVLRDEPARLQVRWADGHTSILAPAAVGALGGLAAMYTFDPRLGARRRRMLRDRMRSRLRRGWRASLRLERRMQSRVFGQVMAAAHRPEAPKGLRRGDAGRRSRRSCSATRRCPGAG